LNIREGSATLFACKTPRLLLNSFLLITDGGVGLFVKADPAIFLFQNVSKQNYDVRGHVRMDGLTLSFLLLTLVEGELFVPCQQAWVQFMYKKLYTHTTPRF
jgi:hypothetical protein